MVLMLPSMHGIISSECYTRWERKESNSEEKKAEDHNVRCWEDQQIILLIIWFRENKTHINISLITQTTTTKLMTTSMIYSMDDAER